MFKADHTGKEAVELHKDLQVHILAFWCLAMGAAHMVTVQIDTCSFIESAKSLQRCNNCKSSKDLQVTRKVTLEQ